MAVIIKKKNPMSILKVFKCNDDSIKLFNKLGGSISSGNGSLVFSQNDKIIVKIALKDQVLKMVMANKLGAASKAAIQHKIHKALDTFIQKVLKDSETVIKLPKAGFDFGTGDKSFEIKGTSSGTYKPDTYPSNQKTINPYPNKECIATTLKMKPTPLKYADRMYQPVTATSVGSVYHVICLTDELKIAARLKGVDSISLRVEGNIAKHKKCLVDAGFNVETGDTSGYYSLHLSTGSKGLTTRTVGAVLSLIPNVKTIKPELSIIEDKGK